ncbi:MAG TPA: hypothetical protein VHC47_06660, partial [Mucilaginibacter sp.]|nr:hypothetical protein [Mucilaginibacter sp.]
MSNLELENYLKKCIIAYVQEGKVFDKWFLEKGKGYYFLFKKNLKVTNLQFAELASLIRLNAQREGDYVGEQLLFLSVKEFNTSFFEILKCFTSDKKKFESVKKDPSKLEGFAHDLSKQFIGLLKNVVVLDAFYGSCAVYLPPGIEIFIDRICSHSGYIHSCGKNIFTRNVSKANKIDFLKSIKNYIDSSD